MTSLSLAFESWGSFAQVDFLDRKKKKESRRNAGLLRIPGNVNRVPGGGLSERNP